MSLPLDPVKSAAARAEGNTSFKRGKWTEAIGHYTCAIVADRSDGIPFSNRAAAYLKLDKFQDAERDALDALERIPNHAKSLYRLALARKGLENYEDALKDLERLVGIDKSRDALEERDTVKGLLEEQRNQNKKKQGSKGILPPCPPRSASIQEINDQDRDQDGDVEMPQHSAKDANGANAHGDKTKTVPTPGRPLSYAQLQKARDTRKTHVSSPSLSSSSSPADSSTKTQTVAASSSDPTPAQPANATRIPVRVASPPLHPTSTSPASGLALLRQISTLNPSDGWAYLEHYPPDIIPVIVNTLLEPDTLGRILLCLRVGVDTNPSSVKVILEGLRKTGRWGINCMMLDANEQEAGKQAWAKSGAAGSW